MLLLAVYSHKICLINQLSKIVFVFFASTVLFGSCRPGNNQIPATAPDFDSALTVADHIYDSGGKIKALEYIIQVHAHCRDLKLPDEMNYYMFCNTVYVKDMHNYDRSMATADSMLAMLDMPGRDYDMPGRRIDAYNMKANALMAKGIYNEAYNNYYKAKQLAAETADSCGICDYSYNLGMVLYKQQKYSEAANYFKQCYTETFRCPDNFSFFYRRQEVLDNAGLSYGKMKQYDSAMAYYTKALKYIDENKDHFTNKSKSVYEMAEAVIYGNMANLYLDTKRYDTAKTLIKKSISVNLQKGYANSDAQLEQVRLADLYMKLSDMDSLKGLLQDMKAELDTLPSKYVSLEWNRLMSSYYEQKKDSAKAFPYILAYIKLNDSFQVTNKQLREADIEVSIKNAERQYDIYILESEQFRQRTYLAIAAFVALMAITIVVLLVRSSSRADKNVKELTLLNNKVNDQKEKLEKALRELELKNNDNSRILRSVAHDVMSPIAAIAALTDILISESDAYSDDHKEIYELIKEACGNSLNLSKDILEAAATIAPGVLTKEWVDINKLLAGSVELLGFRATEKKQTLVINMPDHDIKAFVNKEKIWRVINNLITNAIKFSYEGTDIKVDLNKANGNIIVVVSDKGLGIPQKYRAHIFDMFTESKMTGTAGEKPNGLGLSISLQIARAHGGNIRFESEEGKGATFYFTFPENIGG